MNRLLVFVLLSGLLITAGCSHTLEGIGKDMQELGKSIEDATDK